MMEQIQRARMRQKHDLPANWRETKSFVPKPGEFIVYDKDDNSPAPRIKIGDGESLVNDLAMIGGEVYTTPFEPLDAGEGAVWIQTYDNEQAEIEAQLNGDIIGYRYNGEFLPALPNWNKVEYPQGFITKKDGVIKFYIVNRTPSASYLDGIFYGANFTEQKKSGLNIKYYYRVWKCVKENDTQSWQTDGKEYEVISLHLDSVIWTYKDIVSSGIVAFHATKPKPIYNYDEQIRAIDWNVNTSGKTGYIRNRPMWHEQKQVSLQWDEEAELFDMGMGIGKVYHAFDLHSQAKEISNIKIYLFRDDVQEATEWSIHDTIISTSSELETLRETNKIYFVSGAVWGLSSNYICLVCFDNSMTAILGVISKTTNEEQSLQGIYFCNDYAYRIAKMSFEYSYIEVNSLYESVFKNQDAINIYSFNDSATKQILELIEKQQLKEAGKLLQTELSKFKTNDILLIPSYLLEELNNANSL